MLIIYLHQLREHLQSSRFQISLFVLLTFFAANGVVYIWKLEKLQREIAMLDRADEKVYRDIDNVQAAGWQWYRNQGNHPTGLEFIVDGGIDLLSTTLVTPTRTGTMPYQSQSMTRNIIIDNFQVIDWVLIVRVVISFLCVVLAYDTVSREVEAGTLQLVLSNPVSRATYLAGKYLAHLTTVMLSVLVGSLVSLVVLAQSGRLAVGHDLIVHLALFLVGVAMYATLFIFLAMGVSALVRSSASSSVVLVLLWAISVVIIPQMSALIGLQAADVSYASWRKAYDYYGEAEQALADRGLTFRGVSVGAVDGYAQERQVARHLREAEQEQERIYREIGRKQAQQWRIARTINLLSPGYAFQYGVEAVLGVGVVHRDALEEQNWAYRKELREFFYQTDDADPDSPHIRFFPNYMSKAPIDHRQIPRYRERRLTVVEGVQAGAAPLLILILEMVGTFLFAHWAMVRADVGRE